MKPEILYEDVDIIVLRKPAKIPVQSKKLTEADMVSLIKTYLYEQAPEKGEPYVGLVHRLDQPVEGIMVMAKNQAAAKGLSGQIAGGLMDKHYLAVVTGAPVDKTGHLKDYLLKDGKNNISKVVNKDIPQSKLAELKYQVVNQSEGVSLVNIELLTGRHHQIRVQLANAGMPIWGDAKYNNAHQPDDGWKQIALCSYQLSFHHPKTKKLMKFEIQPNGEIFKNLAVE